MSKSVPKVTVGAMLIGIAIVHTFVGVLIGLGFDPSIPSTGAPAFGAMLADGVIDSVGADPVRGAVTWFLLWGFVLALVGLVSHQSERAGLAPSRSFAWSFGAMCVLGVVLMPASGFWLGFGPTLIAFRRAQPSVLGA